MAMHAALQDWVLTELRFDEWVCFVLAALLLRVAIVIASITKARGRLVVSFGLLAVCAGLGYLFAWSPSHLAGIEASRVLAADRATWLLFGALVGLGFALARALGHAARSRIGRLEVVVVAPILAITILWAAYSGAQANGWYLPGPRAVSGQPAGAATTSRSSATPTGTHSAHKPSAPSAPCATPASITPWTVTFSASAVVSARAAGPRTAVATTAAWASDTLRRPAEGAPPGPLQERPTLLGGTGC